MTLCSIAGCGLPVLNKGYCRAHYRRLWRYGDPLAGGVFRKRVIGKCLVDGCGRDMAKGGMCNAHYLRMRRHGRLDTVRRTTPNKCGAQWCPGAKAIDNHMHYRTNQESYKARALAWEKKPENWQKKLDYWGRADVQKQARIRTRQWTRDNPAKKKAMDKAFNEANRALVTSYKAARRARVLQATPSWLTAEHWTEIRAVYAEAEKLTHETGIPHEVDHIVPLQGKSVCGLHVPWNLRAIPKDHNNRRARVWTGEDDYALKE